ncbi:MAG TPA: hypothetical protein VIG99_10220 [Myxococcaceae bacterium]|jgi:hypothetical protein
MPTTLRSLLVLTLFAAGCCRNAWDAFPMSTPPDRQCHMGSTHGHDLYIWDCASGQKVVVGRFSAEMSCQSPEQETAACGAFTPLETQYHLDTGASCPTMPDSLQWPR